MTFLNDNPVPALSYPVIDYTSRDYQSVYSDLLIRKTVYLSEWTGQSNSDFGIALLQMYSYVCDLIGYYMDRLAGEMFIQTATQPSSILNIAGMLNYQPTLSMGASGTVQVKISTILSHSLYPVVIPAGTQFSTVASATQPAIVFQTTATLSIPGPTAATPSYVGSVGVLQGVTQTSEQLGTSTGAVNQAFSLAYNPVSANSWTVYVDLGLGPQPWTYVQNLINYGPTSQVYTTFVDANNVFYIIFGDGANGYVPPLGSPITCTYQTNSGAIGNVGASTITQIVTSIVGVTSVTNPSPASGGENQESLAGIQQAAPAGLLSLNRAVTTMDFATLVFQVAGVQWVNAQEVTYQLVNLYVAPIGGGSLSSALQAQISAYLAGPPSLTLAGTTVTLFSPTYVDINITIVVTAYANWGNTVVQSAVLAAINNVLSLSNTGFGYRISLGLIFSTVLGVPGVSYAEVTSLNRQVLCTLTSALSLNSNYTSLAVTQLPEPVNINDVLILTNSSGGIQGSITVSTAAAAGATTILVNLFTANATYPIGADVQDVTGTNDCIMLTNEIPVAGNIAISVSGGIPGS